MRFWTSERVALVAASLAVGFAFALTVWPTAKRFEWETILTGVLAIAAAAWSVTVSREIDAQQERRHRDLINLTMRSERLRARRAAAQKEFLDYMIHQCPPVPVFNEKDPDETRRAAREMQGKLQLWQYEIAALINHRSISEAHDLFEPDMMTSLEVTNDALVDLKNAFYPLEAAAKHGTLAGANDAIHAANTAASEVYERASNFLAELESFERTYAGAG